MDTCTFQQHQCNNKQPTNSIITNKHDISLVNNEASSELFFLTPVTRRANFFCCLLSCAAMAVLIFSLAVMLILPTLVIKPTFGTSISIAAPGDPFVKKRNYNSLIIKWNNTFDSSLIKYYNLIQATSKSDLDGDKDYDIVYNGTDTQTKILNLQAGTIYYYKLKFETINNQVSNWSDVSSIKTLDADVPTKIELINVMETSTTTVTIHFSPPFDRGATIQQYIITSICNDNPLEVTTVKTTYTLSNLMPGERCNITFTAKNSVGRGNSSREVEVHSDVTAAALPSPPPSPSLLLDSVTFISLKWGISNDNGAMVTRSQLQISSNTTFDSVYEGPNMAYIVTGLSVAKEYNFRLRQKNSIGWSEWSSIATFSTLSAMVPSPPFPPKAFNKTTTSIRVVWDKPFGNGKPVSAYELQQEQDDGQFSTVYTGQQNSVNITKLVASHKYAFKVRAQNEVGWSKYSKASNLSTLGLCSDPQDLAAFSTDSDHFNDVFTKCGNRCFGKTSCVANCLHQQLHLSSPCATCYGKLTNCGSKYCKLPCLQGSNSLPCTTCSAKNCLASCNECMGVPCTIQPILNDYCAEYGSTS